MHLLLALASLTLSEGGAMATLWKVIISSGAIAGYLSLLWNFWNARVRLAVHAEQCGFGDGIRFSVSNQGNRPTTLTGIEVKEAVRNRSLCTHNIGTSPETGGIQLPGKLEPGDHWTGSVFQAETPGDGCDEEALRRYDRHRSRFAWLADETAVESCVVFMHFSHRRRPYRLRVRPEGGGSIGCIDVVRLWCAKSR